MSSLADLVEDMKQGAVELLVILGGNPVFTAPRDLEFANALERCRCGSTWALRGRDVSRSATGTCRRRTSWKLGRRRAFDGTATICSR